jgi:uncharacterized membrane protein
MSRRREWGAIALGGAALGGILDSTYLTVVHYSTIPLVCTNGGVIDCAAVTSSTYSVVPGTAIPVALLGIVWFAVSGGLALLATVAAWRRAPEPSWLASAHVIWAMAGLASVLYLVFGEISLRRICEWCTVVHLLVVTSLLIALARWQRAHAVRRHEGDPGLRRAG